MYEVILKRFDKPDAVRNFEKGKFELVKVGKMTIGRATYEPGWKWSEHVGKVAGEKSCMVEHIGLVVAGRATAAMDDGRVIEMKPGISSTLPPDTTAGSSVMSRTCRFTSLGLSCMRSRSLNHRESPRTQT